ncbi:hypothetical protein CsSME_00004262 [Camellia sinensis var. sinensis]
MGLSPESADAVKVGNWVVDKSKEREDEDAAQMGCWFKFRFLERCMPSRSKVESSISCTSTQDVTLT